MWQLADTLGRKLSNRDKPNKYKNAIKYLIGLCFNHLNNATIYPNYILFNIPHIWQNTYLCPKALLPSICPPHTGCSSEKQQKHAQLWSKWNLQFLHKFNKNSYCHENICQYNILVCTGRPCQREGGGGMPDNMEVRQYRLTEYPIPVHSSHCSHDKGHLYASFGARFPGQCHKRLPLWSVVGLSWKKGSGWQPQSFQYGANSICICLSHPSPITRPAPPSHCLCLCFGPDLQVAP